MCLCMYMLMLLDIVITGGVNLRSNFSPSVPFSFIIPYMSLIVVFDESGKALEVIKDYESIKERLASIGVRFERWETNRELPWSATQEEVLQAYKEEVDRIVKEFDFKSIDVVSLTPDHPKREELRNMLCSRV